MRHDDDDEGATSAPLSYAQAMKLEALDRSSRLSHWMSAFAADEEAFASKAVFVEMRLRQALSSSVMLGVPNTFRCAVVCDAFERVAPMTGRYEGVLVIIWKELVKAIFMDYTPDLPGSGAKAYAERTPYFLEVKRLRELYEAAGSAVLVPTKLPDLTALVATGSHLVVLQIYDGDGADERSMQLAQPYADVASALDSLVIFVAVDVRRRRRLAEQIAEKCVLVSPRLSLSREREREMRIERR